jgi:hypothetical protein
MFGEDALSRVHSKTVSLVLGHIAKYCRNFILILRKKNLLIWGKELVQTRPCVG